MPSNRRRYRAPVQPIPLTAAQIDQAHALLQREMRDGVEIVPNRTYPEQATYQLDHTTGQFVRLR